MRASSVMVHRELLDNQLQVSFAQRNEVVQALPANGADQPLAERVRFRCSHWRSQNTQAESVQRLIQANREDGVAVMNQDAVRVVERQKLTELLDGPLGGRMSRHVGVQDAARTGLHGHEDVQNTEPSHDGNEKVTGHDGPGLIPHECRPAQVGGFSSRRAAIQLFVHRSRRYPQAEFEAQLIGDSLFAPGGVLAVHLTDQLRDVAG